MPDIEGPLENTLELSADWWLPSSPETTVHGRVTYTPGYLLKAEFEGGLGVEFFHGDSNHRVDSIFGASTRGDAYTLLRCWPTGQKSTGNNISEQTVSPELLVVGEHIHESDNFKADKVELHLLHLEAWIGRKVFGERWAWNFGTEDEKGSVITDIPEDCRRFNIASIDGRLSIHHRVLSRGNAYQFLELNHLARIAFEANGRGWFDWYSPKIAHLERLMTLLVQAPVRTRGVGAHVSGGTENSIVELYFDRPNGRYSTTINPHKIALPLPMLGDMFEDVLDTWFKKEDLLRVPLELYLESLHHRGPSLSVPLLDLVRAVEVMHRATKGGTYLPEESFERLLPELYLLTKSVPDEFDADYKASLRSRLKYSNEYSLRKRMALIQKTVQQLPGHVIADSFWGRVVDTRNYLTHYSEELKDSAHKEEEYPNVVLVLRHLMALMLLIEAGVPEELAREGLSRSFDGLRL